MGKKANKPRWKAVSPYQLVVKKVQGTASPDEVEAATAVMKNRLQGGRAEVFEVRGKLVVR